MHRIIIRSKNRAAPKGQGFAEDVGVANSLRSDDRLGAVATHSSAAMESVGELDE